MAAVRMKTTSTVSPAHGPPSTRCSCPTMFHRYIDPQESGNRTEIRWAHSHQPDGRQQPARRCHRRHPVGNGVLSLRRRGHHLAMHPTELPPRDFYTLNLDHRQSGLGGTNSWGALALPKYRIQADKAYRWSFMLTLSETPEAVDPSALRPGRREGEFEWLHAAQQFHPHRLAGNQVEKRVRRIRVVRDLAGCRRSAARRPAGSRRRPRGNWEAPGRSAGTGIPHAARVRANHGPVVRRRRCPAAPGAPPRPESHSRCFRCRSPGRRLPTTRPASSSSGVPGGWDRAIEIHPQQGEWKDFAARLV